MKCKECKECGKKLDLRKVAYFQGRLVCNSCFNRLKWKRIAKSRLENRKRIDNPQS